MIVETEVASDGHKPTVRKVFSNKDYLKLWIGQFVSNTGSSITLIVLPLFVYFYTGSTYWLGIISLDEVIPILVVTPFAGVFADTHNRKLVMIGSDLLNTFLIFLIPILITFDNAFNTQVILIGITIDVFLGASVTRFFMPARSASIPRIVDKDELRIAVSISQTTFQLIMAIGPIIGAAVATFIGYRYAFILDGLSFIFSAITLVMIKTDLKPLQVTEDVVQNKPSLLLGTKKLFQIKSLRFLMIIFSFLIFADASINTFLVAFVKYNLKMSDVQYGTTLTILGASGVVAGILLTSKISNVKKPIFLTIFAFVSFGFVSLPFAIITKAWQLYLVALLIGPLNILINVPVNIIFFRETTDDIRGQVFSALNMMVSLFTIVGIIYGTIFSPIIGLRELFFLNALLIIIIGIIGLIYLLFINNLDNLDSIETKPTIISPNAIISD